MPTVETTLGHLEWVANELELRDNPISYVFKLGCGCSVYSKDDVFGHLWDKCEHQDSDFWCDRYTESGRTVKHHVRIDEIDTIWAGLDVCRSSLDKLRKKCEELEPKLDKQNTKTYVEVLKKYDIINPLTMTLLEEKEMRDEITAWYLKENVNPPQFEELHKLALAKIALDSIILTFETDMEAERLTLFGFADTIEP